MDREKFRQLPLKKKVGYLLKNHCWDMLLAAVLLVTLGTWVWEDMIVGRPTLEVEMINVQQESSGGEAFAPFLMSSRSAPGDEVRVEVSKDIQYGQRVHNVEDGPGAGARLLTNVLSGRTDLYFWNDTHTGWLLCRSALEDLREVLPQEVLQEHQDHVVYDDEHMPYGIRLEHNHWVQGNGYYEDCVVGVAKYAKDKTQAATVLQCILAFE